MLKDGICKVRDGFFTKTIAYEDINYSVASSDDQAAIFESYCAFLNYFDSALPFQMSFINHRSRPENRYTVNITPQDDEFNSIRGEYVDMLERQIARSNTALYGQNILRLAFLRKVWQSPDHVWSVWKRILWGTSKS